MGCLLAHIKILGVKYKGFKHVVSIIHQSKMWTIWILLSWCLLQQFAIKIPFSMICSFCLVTSKSNICIYTLCRETGFRWQTFLVMLYLLARNNHCWQFAIIYSVFFSWCLKELIIMYAALKFAFFFFQLNSRFWTSFSIWSQSTSTIGWFYNDPVNLSGILYSLISNYLIEFLWAQRGTDFHVSRLFQR